MEATIVLDYGNERIAEAVAAAVSPDNLKVPVGLSVKTERIGCKVVSEVKSDGKLLGFISTIDDLLACVSAAERTLHVVRKKQ